MMLREAFESQSRACANLGSPFTARLMTLAARRLRPGTAVADRLLGWPGDVTSRGLSVPLRLAGSLHRLVLDGSAPALARLWPPDPAEADDDTLWAAIQAAFGDHSARLLDLLRSPPQTNEVRRAAVLMPVLHMIAGQTGLPLSLAELGASAGLNLLMEKFYLEAGGQCYGPGDSAVRLSPDWSGPVPDPADLYIGHRAGVDLNPIDATTRDGRMTLLSYIWPDQPDRLTRTDAAIAIARREPPRIERGDAAAWLYRWLSAPRRGTARVVYHSIAWQYFSAQTMQSCEAALARAGHAATADTPLAHVSFEADDDPRGAGLTLTTWPGGDRVTLGRADFHGRWVDWTGPAALA